MITSINKNYTSHIYPPPPSILWFLGCSISGSWVYDWGWIVWGFESRVIGVWFYRTLSLFSTILASIRCILPLSWSILVIVRNRWVPLQLLPSYNYHLFYPIIYFLILWSASISSFPINLPAYLWIEIPIFPIFYVSAVTQQLLHYASETHPPMPSAKSS